MKRSSWLVIVAVVMAALLILCFCCLAIGGGVAWFAVLSPTPSPTSVPGRVKTYSNTALGFSIQYPADWSVKVGTGLGGQSITFTGKGGLSNAVIGVVPGFQGDEKTIINSFVSAFEAQWSDLEIASEGTKTFNQITWHYLAFTSTSSGVASKGILYARIHTNGTAYVFTGLTSAHVYEEETQTYTRMMESFRFLRQ